MIYGSVPSILIFLVASFGAITLLSAFSLSEICTAILLTLAGYYYGRSHEKSNQVSILYGFVNLGLVSFVLFLELWAHHQRL